MLGLGVARPDLSDYRGHLILSPCQGLDPPPPPANGSLGERSQGDSGPPCIAPLPGSVRWNLGSKL